jgi:hypothetical protein
VVLRSLTVFQSSFSRQAAQAVSGASIQLLMALQNKSWLQVQNGSRYQIHELLCQYANENLQADPSTWQPELTDSNPGDGRSGIAGGRDSNPGIIHTAADYLYTCTRREYGHDSAGRVRLLMG